MSRLLGLGIKELSNNIRNREISPVQLVKKLLDEIENEKYHAFITINKDEAIKEARKLEAELIAGEYRGPLHGMPISIKDNIQVKDLRLTNGAAVKEVVPDSDAAIVSRLKEQGAIIVGKTNMDEFANNIVGKNNNFGTIINPIQSGRTAGGSSGGSAVSVAANLSYGSIGTDTSGSVRIPASCCGVAGLKPTNGLFSMEGITPLSWSLDVAGIFAKDCEDMAMIFESIVPGGKENKSTNLGHSTDIFNGLRVGLLNNYFSSEDQEIQQAMNQAVTFLEKSGATIKRKQIDHVEQFMENHIPLASTESYYYYKQLMKEMDPSGYDDSNYNFFMTGKNTSKEQYMKAKKFKDELMFTFKEMFSEVDVILTPTLPIIPPKLEDFSGEWEYLLGEIIKFTGPVSMSGLPALSIPFSTSKEGLSIGLQLIGNSYEEERLLQLGSKLMDGAI